MKELVRMMLAGFAAVAAYVFLLILLDLILPPTRLWGLTIAAAVIGAGFVARFVWRRSESVPDGIAGAVGRGAVLCGGIGFVAGFFGPMIFAPGANQGPMLGIFITGPLGVVVGAIGGAVQWARKRIPSR